MEELNTPPVEEHPQAPDVVPEPAPATPEPQPQPQPEVETEVPAAWHERLRSGLQAQFDKRGVSRATLALSALVPAGLGALCLIIEHPGLGAVAGLLALGAAWIATAPVPEGALEPGREAGRPIALFAAHTLMPLLLGGAVMAAAAAGAPAHAGLAAWAAFVLLLLPLVRALGGEGTLTKGPLLWSWEERALALLAGMLLGHVGLTLFVTALVATGDLLLRLVLLYPRRADRPALTGALGRLFAPDGEPQPGVRLACGLSLALLVVLCVALGASEGWRF